MHTYFITYYFYNNLKIRFLNFNREIKTPNDVLNVEKFLKKMYGSGNLTVISFSKLDEPYDDIVYDLDTGEKIE